MEIIRTPIAEISFNKNDGILNIKLVDGAEMSLENAKIQYEKINALLGGAKHLALVDASNYYTVERKAWAYASQKEIFSNRMAVAHFNSSAANKLTTSFFKTACDSAMPMQTFNMREQAVKWLKSFSLE